jgi:hypothetical protein
MRTALFLLVGFLLLAACLLLGRLFSASFPGASSTAAVAFTLLWLALCAFNLWVGVARAGYSLSDEAPIFLLLFGVPVAVAVLLRWRFL